METVLILILNKTEKLFDWGRASGPAASVRMRICFRDFDAAHQNHRRNRVGSQPSPGLLPQAAKGPPKAGTSFSHRAGPMGALAKSSPYVSAGAAALLRRNTKIFFILF